MVIIVIIDIGGSSAQIAVCVFKRSIIPFSVVIQQEQANGDICIKEPSALKGDLLLKETTLWILRHLLNNAILNWQLCRRRETSTDNDHSPSLFCSHRLCTM